MSLTLDLERFIAKAKGNASTVVREVSIQIVVKTVDRSPVGNPELWAANAHATQYNAEVASYNSALRENPDNLTKAGRLRKGLKLNDGMDLTSGDGYVGGRFRGNWQVTFNTAASGTLARIDGQGAATIAAATGVVMGFTSAVGAIWVVNNLPYANRLEYEGWSKQAPAGMVRITLNEFQAFVNKAVEGLP